MQSDKKAVVYLAGGMRSGWQDYVIKAVPHVEFIDPRTHGLADEKAYTDWDLAGVDRADIVFGFMEKDNPSGAGLALEFGYAKQAGKRLIYVEADGFPFSRYFGMVRAVSDVQATTLDQGLLALLRMVREQLAAA